MKINLKALTLCPMPSANTPVLSPLVSSETQVGRQILILTCMDMQTFSTGTHSANVLRRGDLCLLV